MAGISAVSMDQKGWIESQQVIRASENREINIDRNMHQNPSIPNPVEVMWNLDLKL